MSDTILSISEKANYLAQWLFDTARFIESREGKKFLASKECIYPNLDADGAKKGLQGQAKIALASVSDTRLADFTYSTENWATIAEKFRAQAEEIVSTFKLKFTLKMKNKSVNASNIWSCIDDLSEVFSSGLFHKCYPISLESASYPRYFSDSLHALHELKNYLVALKTLRKPTNHPIFNSFLRSLRSRYFANNRYLFDILTHDATSLSTNPNQIIKFNACYPSSSIVTSIRPDSAFVFIDFKTGKITGESKIMFHEPKTKIPPC